MIRSTHTYATLEVSAEAYDEIYKLLELADYQHAFHDGLIDMHGIALGRAKPLGPPHWSTIRVVELELSVRSYNCLIGNPCWRDRETSERRCLLTAESTLHELLEVKQIQRLKNFGPGSFWNIFTSLQLAGVPLADITLSAFFQSAHSDWKKRTLARIANTQFSDPSNGTDPANTTTPEAPNA